MPDLDYSKFNNLGISPEVLKYLSTLGQQQNRAIDPRVLASLSQSMQPNMTPSLIATLGKSAAQMGTLGGKVADTSALSDNAKALQGAQSQDAQNALTGYGLQQKGVDQQMANADKFAGAQEKEHQIGEELASKERVSKNMANAMADRFGIGQQNKVNQRVTEFGKAMNEGTASSRTGMGRLKGLQDASDQILAMEQQAKTQPGGLDNRQMHEIAMSTAKLLGGGSIAAQESINALVPHTIGNNIAKIEEWLTGEPQGTDQQAFVQRMFDTAHREGQLATEKIKQIKSQAMGEFADLKSQAPEQYNAIVQQNFSPDDQFKNGLYVMKPFQLQKSPSAPPGGTALAAPSAPPKMGEMKTIKNVQYKWDGSLWQPLTGTSPVNTDSGGAD